MKSRCLAMYLVLSALVLQSACQNSSSNVKQRSSRWHQGPLFAIVTGHAHSGTTLLKNLLSNLPGVFGAFTIGFLLAPSPWEFNESITPWYTFAQRLWQVKDEDLMRIRRSPDFLSMYERLRHVSKIASKMPGVRLIDKTPRYMKELDVLRKVPANIPVLISYKETKPSALIKAEKEPRLRDRIFGVEHYSLVMDPNYHMKQVLTFLGWHPDAWDDRFVNMTGVYDKLKPVLGECMAAHTAASQALSYTKSVHHKNTGVKVNKNHLGKPNCSK